MKTYNVSDLQAAQFFHPGYPANANNSSDKHSSVCNRFCKDLYQSDEHSSLCNKDLYQWNEIHG